MTTKKKKIVETDDSVFTLATCYYRSQRVHEAFWLLNSKDTKSAKCKFLQAKCAFELKKYVYRSVFFILGQ